MAIRATDGLVPYWHESREDKKEGEEPTRFKLQPLNGEVAAQVIIDMKGGEDLTERGVQLCIRHGLIGWENFLGPDDKPMKFSLARVSKLPPSVIAELASEILTNSRLTVDDEKN